MIGFLLLMSTHAFEYLNRVGVYKASIYKRQKIAYKHHPTAN